MLSDSLTWTMKLCFCFSVCFVFLAVWHLSVCSSAFRLPVSIVSTDKELSRVYKIGQKKKNRLHTHELSDFVLRRLKRLLWWRSYKILAALGTDVAGTQRNKILVRQGAGCLRKLTAWPIYKHTHTQTHTLLNTHSHAGTHKGELASFTNVWLCDWTISKASGSAGLMNNSVLP